MADKPRLHQLLAVEGNLKTQSDKSRADLMNTFEKKRNLFTASLKTYFPDKEGADSVREEQHDLNTTVPKEIKWYAPFFIKALDGAYQVDEANTQARADIVLDDGTIIAENVPATFLLQLEKRMQELRDFVMAIPTLDPVKGFKPDPDHEMNPGVYKAREDYRPRTEKRQEPLVLYPHSDKHPAQTQLITRDVPIGKLVINEWSGLMTPSDKGKLIENVEEVTRAVKRGRSKANEADIDPETTKIGLKLLRHIFVGYI